MNDGIAIEVNEETEYTTLVSLIEDLRVCDESFFFVLAVEKGIRGLELGNRKRVLIAMVVEIKLKDNSN